MTATAVGIAHVPSALRLSSLDTAEIPRIVFPCPDGEAAHIAGVRKTASAWAASSTAELAAAWGISEEAAGVVRRTAADALAELDAEETCREGEQVDQEFMDGVEAILNAPEGTAREKLARARRFNAEFDWRGHR
ncbi:hypothetical protein GCM10022251_19780 [Phytohabitans flavus]|uniref:Uncharacterized protein n=1 Tax=Phytohabitans flavus TaxID=1076124 RepID=A0A6F8XZB6_9ACTN|nr:hypothetical protein [Phytohabitans flavus]BCB79153.1 hypothetical protein Pflav_055630 [Phytohabitans flavus]